jgi:hypothetical protein
MLVQRQPHRRKTAAQRGCFLERDAGWDMHGKIAFHQYVLREGPVLGLKIVAFYFLSTLIHSLKQKT